VFIKGLGWNKFIEKQPESYDSFVKRNYLPGFISWNVLELYFGIES